MSKLSAFPLLFAGASALAIVGPASAETLVGADVSVNGGYATNPFSGGGGSTGSATATAAINPFIALISPSGETRITGDLRRTEYSRRYDGQTDFGGGIATNLRASSRTTIGGNVNYTSRVVNALNPIFSPLNPLPIDPNSPVIIDPGQIGTFQRRTKMLTGGLQLQQQLGARDTLILSGSGSMARFSNSNIAPLQQGDYDFFGGGIGYQRAISSQTSVGLNVNANRTTYKTGGFGNSTSISPAATIATKLSPRLTLSADAGVTFTDTDVAGGSRKFTALSGQINLCNNGSRSNLCVRASRSVAPSPFNGVSKNTSAGLSYSYDLDARSQLSAGLSYARQSSISGLSNMGSFDFGYASLGYSRQISRRLAAVATVSYADSFKSIVARKANFYGSVGIRYRIGDIR